MISPITPADTYATCSIPSPSSTFLASSDGKGWAGPGVVVVNNSSNGNSSATGCIKGTDARLPKLSRLGYLCVLWSCLSGRTGRMEVRDRWKLRRVDDGRPPDTVESTSHLGRRIACSSGGGDGLTRSFLRCAAGMVVKSRTLTSVPRICDHAALSDRAVWKGITLTNVVSLQPAHRRQTIPPHHLLLSYPPSCTLSLGLPALPCPDGEPAP